MTINDSLYDFEILVYHNFLYNKLSKIVVNFSLKRVTKGLSGFTLCLLICLAIFSTLFYISCKVVSFFLEIEAREFGSLSVQRKEKVRFLWSKLFFVKDSRYYLTFSYIFFYHNYYITLLAMARRIKKI